MKIAFNQPNYDKVVLMYRILEDRGYTKRIRVYDFNGLQCSSSTVSEKDISNIKTQIM
mgnify:CR=1 FL=1